MAKKKNNKKAAPAPVPPQQPIPPVTGAEETEAPAETPEVPSESQSGERKNTTNGTDTTEEVPQTNGHSNPILDEAPTETTNVSATTKDEEKSVISDPSASIEKQNVEENRQLRSGGQESTPIITEEPEKAAPTPVAPAPKKRLTLQERLALAAKSGKSSKRSSSTPVVQSQAPASKTASPEPEQTPQPSIASAILTPELAPSSNGSVQSTREPSMDIPRSDNASLFPSNFKELPTEELLKLVNDAQNKYIILENKTKSLSEEKSSLQEKVKRLSSAATMKAQSPPVSTDEKLLKEKDEKIAALLKEGEELSMKELKFNNTIKRLKAKEADNEYELENLRQKVATLESEAKKNKDSLKKSLEAEQQASVKVKSLQKQLDHEKEALKEEIGRTEELSKKIEEVSSLIVQEKNQSSKEINDLKRQVEKEKQKVVVAREEHSREVQRLEEKIEQLRFQAENAQTTTSSSDDGYSKLLKQYDTLQKQYTSATENWQSIEASLMNKVSTLEDEVLSLQNRSKLLEQKNTVLANDLEQKINALDETTHDLKTLKSEHTKLEAKLESTKKALEEVEETLQTKEVKFNQEKSSLAFKIQSLEREAKDTIQPQTLMVDTSVGSFASPFSRNTSTPSFKQRQWESRDIGLGESSTTPLQSRKTSTAYLANDYFDERGDDSLSDFGDNDTIDSPVSNANTPRLDNYSSSVIGVGAGGASVQLLGKMSSQVRRLQTEISTMRDEIEKLTQDKKSANEEIVKLMKDNEQVEAYKARIATLEEEVGGYLIRHEKMLEIIGEKSEQVEELKADVQDLKQLCREQVQQLVDLQNK